MRVRNVVIVFAMLLIASISAFATGTEEAVADEITLAIFTSPEEENIDAARAVFEADTGIAITIDEIARNAYQSRFTTVLMSGSDAWDILYLQGAWFQQMAKAGVLASLEGLLSAQTMGQLDAAYQKGIYEDTFYALVASWHTNYYYYRQDMLDFVGLKPATTWDEYLANAKALTGRAPSGEQVYGAVFRGGTANNSIHYDFSNYFLAFGAKWLDENNRPIMNSPQGVAALKFYGDLKNLHGVVPPDVQAVAYNEKNQYVQAGRVAQMVQWSAAYPALMTQAQNPDGFDKMGVQPLPAYVAPDGTRTRGSLATNDMWIIPESSGKFSAAAEFIKWMGGPKGATEWALNGGDPINTVPYSDPRVLAVRPDFEVAAEANLYADTFPDLPEAPQLLSIWSENCGRVVAGELTAKQAMDTIAAEWDKILSAAGYY